VGKSLKGLPYVADAVKVAMGALAFKALSGFVENAVDAIVETLKLARALDTTTEFVSGLQFAVKNLGGDAAIVGTSLAALAAKITDASTGGAAAADVFNRLGLDAKALAGLPLAVAFGRIADAIAAIPDPTRRAAAAYQIFGDSAAGILPILARGSAGLADASRNADAFGKTIHGIDAQRVEEAKIAFDRLNGVLTTIIQQVVIELAPAVSDLAERFEKTGGAGHAAIQRIGQGISITATTVDVLTFAFLSLRAVIAIVGLAFVTLFYITSKGLEKVFELLDLLPDEFKGKYVRTLRETAERANVILESIGKDLVQAIRDPIEVKSAGAEVDQFFNNIKNKAGEAAKAAEKVKTAGDAIGKLDKNKGLFAAGEKTFTAVLTPLQTFTSGIEALNAQLGAGAIGWNTYARGVALAVDNLDKAHQLSEVKLPGAAQRGTVEAQSAIYRGEAQNARNNENPQDRIARILAQAAQIEQEQLAVQRQIAQALQKQPNIALIP
jgi:hypothetical protein